MEYYLDPILGNDNNQEGSKEQPWKTLSYALSDSPLEPGDTLYLRGGRYFESRISVRKSGLIEQPILIRNYKDEEVIIDGSIQSLSESSAWELVDKDRGIYMSIETFPNPCGSRYGPHSVGVLGLFRVKEKTFSLVRYFDKSHLFSDSEYANYVDGYYAGPGVFYEWDKQKEYYERIFLRLNAPYPAIVGQENTFDLEGRKFSLDEVELFITYGTDPSCTGIIFRAGASHLHFQGLTIFNPGLKTAENQGKAVKGLQFRNIKIESAGHGFRFFGVNDEESDSLVFDKVSFTNFLPPWIGWNDAKKKLAGGRPAVAHSIDGRAIDIGRGAKEVMIKNCHFYGIFDGISIVGSGNLNVHDVQILNTRFENILDDGITLGSDTYNIEIAESSFENVGSAVSYQVAGQPKMLDDIGKVYIHHNLITCTPYLLDRAARAGDSPSFRTLAPLSTTHGKTDRLGICPRKIYNNTIVVKDEFRGNNATIHTRFTMPLYPGNSEPIFPENIEDIPKQSHEIYNNIFILEADLPFGDRLKVNTGREIFDGNLYWRPLKNSEIDSFVFWKRITPLSSQDEKKFRSLISFKEEKEWHDLTKAYYNFNPNNSGETGWEASGDEGDPQLDEQYFPLPAGLAASGAVDLKERNWPGYDGQSYRGAFPVLQRPKPERGARLCLETKGSAKTAKSRNHEEAAIILSITDSLGNPILNLSEKHISLRTLLVGPGGSNLEIVRIHGGAQGIYRLDLVPVHNRSWVSGEFIIAIFVHLDEKRGQGLASFIVK